MADFIPPKHNLLLLTLAKFLLALYLKQEKTEVKVSKNCIHTIQQLKNKNTILLLNHSDRADPVIAMALSKDCNEDFYYLAARELFDENMGLRGWFMQNCGAYSVIRGKPEDKESKENTISLIVEGKRKLLMFPEGDVTGRDDKVLPLKKDGLRNIFAAQKHLLQKSPNTSVYLLPIAIFYDVKKDAIKPLENCIRRLAAILNRKIDKGNLEQKTKQLLESFIENLETKYSITKEKDAALQKRLLNISKHVSISIAQAIGVELDITLPETVLLYTVRGALTRQINHPSDQTYIKDLDSMEQLLIIASTLQEKEFTLEVAWRIIDRIEQQITGKVSVKGRRIVYLEASKPINLLEYYSQYLEDPDETIEQISLKVQNTLKQTLEELKSRSTH